MYICTHLCNLLLAREERNENDHLMVLFPRHLSLLLKVQILLSPLSLNMVVLSDKVFLLIFRMLHLDFYVFFPTNE